MKLKFDEILKDVEYKNWAFVVGMDGERCYLQIHWPSKCAMTGAFYVNHSRKWLLSQYMTKSEVVQTAFKAILTAEEHETRELFRYKTKPIFGPHFNVDFLHQVCLDRESLDVRNENNG